jgi:hypothetical protein
VQVFPGIGRFFGAGIFIRIRPIHFVQTYHALVHFGAWDSSAALTKITPLQARIAASEFTSVSETETAQNAVEQPIRTKPVSTIEDVRTAERKMQEILDALKRAGADDPENLKQKLMSASDEYAKAVRELK